MAPKKTSSSLLGVHAVMQRGATFQGLRRVKRVLNQGYDLRANPQRAATGAKTFASRPVRLESPNSPPLPLRDIETLQLRSIHQAPTRTDYDLYQFQLSRLGRVKHRRKFVGTPTPCLSSTSTALVVVR